MKKILENRPFTQDGTQMTVTKDDEGSRREFSSAK